MGQPITTKGQGICFAFPDVCLTPAPPSPSPVPVPYPNIGQLSDASGTASSVKAGGSEVVTSASEIPTTTGNEPANPPIQGKVQFVSFSMTVKAEGNNIVRMFDTTTQNAGNAVGQVLGGFPTVLVGG